MEKGICKLCRQEKLLRKQSHILPKHVYKLLKDNTYKNKMVYVDMQGNYKEPQIGEFEKNILCKDCETKISKYEGYGSDILYDHQKIKDLKRGQIENQNSMKAFVWSGVGYNYKKYKLYLLSILWRMSISSRPFFEKFSAKEDIEEDLRKKVLNEDPGEIHEYPTQIILPAQFKVADSEVEVFADVDVLLMRNPISYISKEITVCDFIILGSKFRIALTSDKKQSKIFFNSVQLNKLIMPMLTPNQTEQRRSRFLEIITEKIDLNNYHVKNKPTKK